jgi:TetR/AcrR family transcriptional regulator
MAIGRKPRISMENPRGQTLAAALKEFSHRRPHAGSAVAIADDVEFCHPNPSGVPSSTKAHSAPARERTFATVEQEMPLRGEGAVGVDRSSSAPGRLDLDVAWLLL